MLSPIWRTMSDFPIPGGPQIKIGRCFLNARTILAFAPFGLTCLTARFSIVFVLLCLLFSALLCLYYSTSNQKGQEKYANFMKKEPNKIKGLQIRLPVLELY